MNERERLIALAAQCQAKMVRAIEASIAEGRYSNDRDNRRTAAAEYATIAAGLADLIDALPEEPAPPVLPIDGESNNG